MPRFRADRFRELLERVDPDEGRQSRCAETLGVSEVAVSEWINGKKQPGGTNLVNLAAYLGTTADDLLQPTVQAAAVGE